MSSLIQVTANTPYSSKWENNYCGDITHTVQGQKILKSPSQKTPEIKKNQFHEKIVWPNSISAISKMAKNQFLNWYKV